ncbi:MAG: DUF3987 domain-containing protein [Bacteroidetes bacterium]|jgi:hypothetical protein|nr:DUF3987 domain-containing protein [Bacteroidota bacterium]
MTISEQLTHKDLEIIFHRLGIEPKGRTDSNGWMTIHSPLRDEKNPSFGLNLQTGAWKDHSTGDSGDVVTLTERINRQDTKEAIKWISEQTDVAAALYSNGSTVNDTQSKKPANFWNDDNLKFIKEGMERLKENSSHQLWQDANSHDCLKLETLLKYGCGIVHKWNSDWLAFPYSTGCQLYRREDGNKIIRSLKGSSPGESFFGMKQTDGKGFLFIAKSPRETMLLSQEFGTHCDVVGIATGEQSNISKEQFRALRTQISASKYGSISIFLDCDTDSALETAKSFTEEISKGLESNFNGEVYLVNIHKATGGAYKDVTDCIRDGMASKSFWALVEDSTSVRAESANSASATLPIFDLKTAPSIPNDVYENLPELLQTRCSLLEQSHRRDVFLVGALPVIASHMPNVLAGHADGYYTPDLFTQIVANPGAGKGVAIKSKKLGEVLNRELIDQSKRERENFESLPDGEKVSLSEPRDRCLFIPANSSSRAIYDTMQANGGSGLLFETEIDTMLNATNQEWGNFSDITRKSFHHESISINRKSEKFFIDNPRLSICITGTFDQFKKMFESAENGHFSRYALYTFDVPRKWQSHRPTKRSRALDDSLETASETLYMMHQLLSRRNEPLYVDLTEEQWGMIDDTFAEKMQKIEDLDLSSYLHASNNRAAVLALRMASMFTVLRTYESNPDHVQGATSLTPSQPDMIAALWLADTFIKHAIRLYNILPKATNTDGKGERYKQFVAALPKEFQTSEALEMAEQLDIPERTTKRWLNNFKRVGHGRYEK